MDLNISISGLFGALICFIADSVAREAIIDGGLAEVYQFPYQISLLLDNKPECGGGIISNHHILTAAHCVLSEFNNFRGSSMSVVAGATDLNNRTSPPAFTIQVDKIYVPSEYNPILKQLTGDIAVLRLRHSLQLHENRHLAYLRMPRAKYEHYVGRVTKIAGYGWDKLIVHGEAVQGGYSDGRLRWADAEVIDAALCQLEHHDHPLDETQICARMTQYENLHRGVCNGDGGSPLTFNTAAVGILSVLPRDCAEKTKAAIYTRVSVYKNFIRHAMDDDPIPGTRTLVLHH